MFLLFAGEHYYPHGGWYDYRGAHASKADAIAAFEARNKAAKSHEQWDWMHVVDADPWTMRIVHADPEDTDDFAELFVRP